VKNLDYGKVAVLLGGRSAEREISLKSGNAVLDALRSQGVDAYPFDPAEQTMDTLLQEQFDRVYVSLHGRYGEDGTIQGALELMGLPYTGSGVLASALAMDKWRTKLIWQAVGICSPRSIVLNEKSNPQEVVSTLGLPLIVKPAREGPTIGLTICKSFNRACGATIVPRNRPSRTNRLLPNPTKYTGSYGGRSCKNTVRSARTAGL